MKNRFNQVLMRVNPEYFNLSEEEQERFRLNYFNLDDDKEGDDNLNDKVVRIFEEYLSKNVFNRNIVDENLKNKDLYEYNRQKTIFSGYGDDSIVLNEFFMIKNCLLDIPTLYDYDYLFEEDQKRLEIAECERENRDKSDWLTKEYEFTLRSIWFRVILNEELVYGSLLSLSIHLGDILSSCSRKIIDELYPHDFVYAKENDDDIWGQLGLAIDAKGKEAFLDELRVRSYKIINELNEKLVQEINQLNLDCVFIEASKDHDGKNLNVIVPNEHVAKKIRWKHFYKDIKKLEGQDNILNPFIDKYKKLLKERLVAEYQDIEANFDPEKVVPIKKMKIVLTEQAKKDFENIFSNDKNDLEDD